MRLNTEVDSAYDTAPVPAAERRGPVTMGLLWITMVTAFPSVLIGFEWFKSGFSLQQVVLGTVLSCLILIAYTVPATQLGARSGLGYIALSRSIFGRWGSRLIILNLILIFVGAYGLFALLLAGAFKDIFHWTITTPLLAMSLAILMCLNNFFGFKGVANFARYFAAPTMIVWVFYTFCKAFVSCPQTVLTEPSHVSFAVALTTISSFVLGYAAWGNEADYWRFSKPKTIYSIIPLVVALLIGQIIFPVTGWMVARATGITEYGAATSLMTSYSCGGISLFSALILFASYFAATDSNLYGLIEAGENLICLKHRTWVCIWAVAAMAMSVYMANVGELKSIEALFSLNCILLPTPTVIMMAEWFLMTYVFRTGSVQSWSVPEYHELPAWRWPATIALLVGLAVGIGTSGIIPGTANWNVGICSVQAWLTALIVYVPLRLIEYKRNIASERVTLEEMLSKASEPADIA